MEKSTGRRFVSELFGPPHQTEACRGIFFRFGIFFGGSLFVEMGICVFPRYPPVSSPDATKKSLARKGFNLLGLVRSAAVLGCKKSDPPRVAQRFHSSNPRTRYATIAAHWPRPQCNSPSGSGWPRSGSCPGPSTTASGDDPAETTDRWSRKYPPPIYRPPTPQIFPPHIFGTPRTPDRSVL